MSPSRRSLNAGLSLIEICLATAILSLLFVATIMHDKQTSHSLHVLETQGRLEDLRLYLRAVIDCGATFPVAPPATCDGVTGIVVRSAHEVLIEDGTEPSSLGGLQLKATCSVDDNSVKSLSIRQRDPEAHPSSAEAGWRSLFEVPYACGVGAVPIVPPPPDLPDYVKCASLAGLGRQSYPSQCSADSAVVAINDGKAPRLTCCPTGPGILSTNPAEQFITRNNHCDADEVMTGMASRHPGPKLVLCTRLDAAVKLGKERRAYKARCSDYPATSPIYQLVNAYPVCDACFCPEATLMLGYHTWTDNKCADRCASVQAK